MNTVKLTINGREIETPAGKTLLEVCKAENIDVPTLCHHPALENIGACRMCLVQIQKVPALQPACTYPATNGIVVETDTQRVRDMRKFVLEMLFSERNHYCMFCELSGDCELQNLAYRNGLDHWTYPTPYPKVPVDGSRKYFIMDHNRCILCRRCVRACADLVGNNTLGVRSRGTKTMVCADMDVPFGESSCVSCGTCLQVCPTGSLIDRKSAYMGRAIQVERTKSACTFCSVGCKTEVISRASHPVRIEGSWDGENTGVLCVAGRFEPFHDTRPRIESPLIRDQRGELKSATWDDAIKTISGKLKARNGGMVTARITGKALNESLEAFIQLFGKKVGAEISTLEPTLSRVELPADGSLADLNNVDTILIIGADPLSDHRLVGYRIQRAKRRGARILEVTDSAEKLSRLSTDKFSKSSLSEAILICENSSAVVVIYGSRMIDEDARSLARLAGKAKFLPLFAATNGRRARSLGLDLKGDSRKSKISYVLTMDSPIDPAQAAGFREAEFLVVHSSYPNALTEVADVVLPSTLWHERKGVFENSEGAEAQVRQVVPMPSWLVSETDFMVQLEQQL